MSGDNGQPRFYRDVTIINSFTYRHGPGYEMWSVGTNNRHGSGWTMTTSRLLFTCTVTMVTMAAYLVVNCFVLFGSTTRILRLLGVYKSLEPLLCTLSTTAFIPSSGLASSEDGFLAVHLSKLTDPATSFLHLAGPTCSHSVLYHLSRCSPSLSLL